MIDDILAAYNWFDHTDGPKFVETHCDAHRSSGHWLFLPGVFSSFHKVRKNEELWLIYLGWVSVLHGRSPTTRTIQRRLRKYGEKVGVDISPHKLRHTMATLSIARRQTSPDWKVQE
jgi:integrase